MDLTGSLIDTNLRIYPTRTLLDFLADIPLKHDLPANLLKLTNRIISDKKQIENHESVTKTIQFNNEDIKNLNSIRNLVKKDTNHISEESEKVENENDQTETGDTVDDEILSKDVSKEDKNKITEGNEKSTNKEENNGKELLECKSQEKENKDENYLTTSDIDWLYNYIHDKRGKGDKNLPFLSDLLQGVQVEMPDNKVIKRNPVLEARCVKLRAQQEAREYRKMTKSVDNVRMRFPEDSINYQLKQVNRQLIAVGQFIISIFAGFLFGFRGVEWIVGNLDFGFRLLLGVMCALVIALAEIYFLAKKLNEELNVPETIQLGGPPKFVNDPYQPYMSNKAIEKEHQD